MVNNITKFKFTLLLVLIVLSVKLISDSELENNYTHDLPYQEALEVRDLDNARSSDVDCSKDYYYDYQFYYFKQEVSQCIGIIFLIISILAFLWLIIPMDYSDRHRHKREV